ncbi:MAG: hypothetical protein ACREO1_16265 [Arenimonas sp.]
MSRDREFEVRDEVMFDIHNVQDTAKHCWTRNRYLQGNASYEAAAETLMVEVLKRIEQGITPGEFFFIFNAWCVVDAITPGTIGIVADVSFADIRWQANFFVRLGRSPALQDANNSN